jgi:cellulose synthase/poly-beta-1,6-N-acetylglucosamine synthase-like glycosyltransferase
MNWLTSLLRGFDHFVLGYFLALNSGYLVLLALATVSVTRTIRRLDIAGYSDIFANPLTPGVSVLVPAHNEETMIVESVRGLLTLRYPEFEVVVIDDGSTDATFARLEEAFDLVEIERVVPHDVPTAGKIHSIFAPRHGEHLVVARKDNAGRRSDPLNAGINVARYPLICMIDADSLLDENALLRVAKPFVDDPERTVGTGGTIRAANGSEVSRGRVVTPKMPRGWVARVQIVEYLRSFLIGRTAWARVGGLLIISGAFGMFRRDILVEVGGLDLDCVGEDAELVTRLHKHLRDQRRDYRLVFLSEPVCWTEVPPSLRVLSSQRRRWSRGLAEVLWKHKAMIGNPRYGIIGLVVLPYYLVFELLGAVVELLGVFAVALSLALGILNLKFAILFFLASVGYGVLLSFATFALEEFSFHRYSRWHDLWAGAGASVMENVGYRQLHAWWRLRGIFAATFGGPTWEEMPRDGFGPAQIQDEPSLTKM